MHKLPVLVGKGRGDSATLTQQNIPYVFIPAFADAHDLNYVVHTVLEHSVRRIGSKIVPYSASISLRVVQNHALIRSPGSSKSLLISCQLEVYLLALR